MTKVAEVELANIKPLGTILNDDVLPAVPVRDASAEQGDDRNPWVQMPVELSNDSAFEINVEDPTVADSTP